MLITILLTAVAVGLFLVPAVIGLRGRMTALERTYEVHKITIALLLAERKGSDFARAALNEIPLPSEEMLDTLLNGGK